MEYSTVIEELMIKKLEKVPLPLDIVLDNFGNDVWEHPRQYEILSESKLDGKETYFTYYKQWIMIYNWACFS